MFFLEIKFKEKNIMSNLEAPSETLLEHDFVSVSETGLKPNGIETAPDSDPEAPNEMVQDNNSEMTPSKFCE